jgi:DNA-binding transcriptional ArsR family regulator
MSVAVLNSALIAKAARLARHLRFFEQTVDIFSGLANLITVMTADAKTMAQYKAQAKVLKALAHPSRLLIVNELSKRERCVCELAEMVGSEMPTVSRHLALLRDAGIVADDKRGAQVFYRLKVPCVMNFFQCIAAVHKKNAQEATLIMG